jgi:hypothetical protein
VSSAFWSDYTTDKDKSGFALQTGFKLSCGLFMDISKFILTFAVFVPAKPLYNAQIGGAFYYIYNLSPLH